MHKMAQTFPKVNEEVISFVAQKKRKRKTLKMLSILHVVHFKSKSRGMKK